MLQEEKGSVRSLMLIVLSGKFPEVEMFDAGFAVRLRMFRCCEELVLLRV